MANLWGSWNDRDADLFGTTLQWRSCFSDGRHQRDGSEALQVIGDDRVAVCVCRHKSGEPKPVPMSRAEGLDRLVQRTAQCLELLAATARGGDQWQSRA